MTHSPIELINAERAEWPETTREYVEWLEAQHNNLLFETYSDKSLLSQIEALARDGLPIEIGGRRYVPEADLAEAAQEARARALAVKPLEWGGHYGLSAANPWGGYHIMNRAGPNQDYDWFGWRQSSRGDFDESEEDYPNIEAAKAAAEADWQARILSALSIPTDAMAALAERDKRVRDEVLEDALTAVNKVFNGFPNHASDAIRAMKGGE